jgi:hypothetical protein
MRVKGNVHDRAREAPAAAERAATTMLGLAAMPAKERPLTSQERK